MSMRAVRGSSFSLNDVPSSLCTCVDSVTADGSGAAAQKLIYANKPRLAFYEEESNIGKGFIKVGNSNSGNYNNNYNNNNNNNNSLLLSGALFLVGRSSGVFSFRFRRQIDVFQRLLFGSQRLF